MSADIFDISGRVAIVTGGSRGIGRAISEEFASRGAKVVVASRKLDACEELAETIRNNGGEALPVACHSGDPDDIERLISETLSAFGRIDTLVNNSAANPWFGPIIDLEMGAYDKTVDVNLRGTLFTSTAAAKVMKEQGGGGIINVGSVNAEHPVVGQGIYSITKGAITTMTKAFAKELAGDKIRVNAILPGVTKTDALRDVFRDSDELPPALKATIPMRRHAMPDEMAGAAVFLASDAASYVTGASILIDGGLTL